MRFFASFKLLRLVEARTAGALPWLSLWFDAYYELPLVKVNRSEWGRLTPGTHLLVTVCRGFATLGSAQVHDIQR